MTFSDGLDLSEYHVKLFLKMKFQKKKIRIVKVKKSEI